MHGVCSGTHATASGWRSEDILVDSGTGTQVIGLAQQLLCPLRHPTISRLLFMSPLVPDILNALFKIFSQVFALLLYSPRIIFDS